MRLVLGLLVAGCQVAPPVQLESGTADLLLEVRNSIGANSLFVERGATTLFGVRELQGDLDARRVEAGASEGTKHPVTLSFRATGAFLLATGAGGREAARGYDGDRAWVQDDRQVVTTQGLGGREYVIADGWLRSLLWLAPGLERFDVEVDERASREDTIVLRLQRAGQPYTITVEVERATQRPRSYAMERHGRTRVVTYEDWSESDGAWYPATMRESIDGRAVHVDRFERRGSGTPRSFAPPVSKPLDASFADPEASESVDGASGVPARVDRGGRFYVEVSIDGQPNAWMLLDTGFGSHALSPARANALGLARSGTVTLSGVGGAASAARRFATTLEVGRLRLERPHFVELETSFLSQRAGFEVDGILGAPLFERATVALDDRRGTVEVSRPGDRRTRGLAWQPVLFDGSAACVRGRIKTPEGETPAIWLRLDTGSDDTLTVARWAVRAYDLEGDRATLSSRRLAGPFGEILGWKKRTLGIEVAGVVIRGPEITLMRDTIPGPLSDPWIAGNVGMRTLRGRRVVLDLSRERIWVGEHE